MSLFDALGEGLQVTVVGLCIVFAVLIILMVIMMLMKVVFYKDSGKNSKAKTEQKTAAQPQAAPKAVQTQSATVVDDSELLAVITAAIAASLNTSTYNLNVKSFRRIQNTSPSWNRAGLRDVIDSRF